MYMCVCVCVWGGGGGGGDNVSAQLQKFDCPYFQIFTHPAGGMDGHGRARLDPQSTKVHKFENVSISLQICVSQFSDVEYNGDIYF